MSGFVSYSGTVWRLVVAGQNPALPVSSPEGRFHYDGQPAIYTSLSPEGTAVAIRRYLEPNGPQRYLVPLVIQSEHLTDCTDDPALSVVWQDVRATGAPAPTWKMSDEARGTGADGMFYASRSRPDLTHLVLFDNFETVIQSVGTPEPWSP